MLQPHHFGQILNQSERFVQSALDALGAHIAILDETGVIIGVNTAWRQFADDNGFHDPTYGLGTNYLEVCDKATEQHSRDAHIVSIGIRDVMSYKQPAFYMEYQCHGNGQKRWFVMNVTRFDWDGSPRYIIAHQNVTELKRVQVELAESQQRIQTILDNVNNGIITLDSKGLIESVNPSAAAIFGYCIEEMHGMPFDILLAEPACTTSTARLLEVLQKSADHEMTGERKDGSQFPIYIGVSKVQLGSRRIFTAIIRDMTERKRMEMEMLEKEKLSLALEKERDLRDLKNRFISMMSHELRTPLASILLSSDLLKTYGDRATPEEKLQYLNNISIQVEHLSELIKDVQTISRGEAQSARYSPEATDLVEYCRTIVDEFNLVHHGTHQIVFAHQYDTIQTRLDTKLMRQVFTNLLSNAIKYSPTGSQIVVNVWNDSRSACIEVADQGIGIPEEDQQHLFEPFHRAANVDGYPGTGLGLAITKQAVELHGGTIEVKSQLNVGTVVTINLPILNGSY